jgi:hypothetical protein
MRSKQHHGQLPVIDDEMMGIDGALKSHEAESHPTLVHGHPNILVVKPIPRTSNYRMGR